MKNQTMAMTAAVCFVVVMTLRLGAQVPIDLSHAQEFRVVWKKVIGGDAGPPKFVPAPCGVEDMDILFVGSSTGGFGCFTKPKIDTLRTVEGWSSVYIPFDYDGVPPLEYMNDAGRVDMCLASTYPFETLRGVDTVNCWGPGVRGINAEFTSDIDGDGFNDLVCDVGGGGYTARVIRGGPNAGRKCERILYVPYAPVEEGTNVNTCLFWRSSSAGFRLMQTEVKENRSWVVIYDVGFRREGNTITTTFTPIDSLTGKGFGGPSHCALVTDTLLKKDWLLMFRFDADINQNVLERFDATDGMFKSTGERVTGVVFYQPWNMGYTLGTSRPVIMLGEGSLCYADDLRQPFARIRFKDSGVQPVAGWTTINDQSGDGKPDLVIAGGVTNGTLILLTLDSIASSVVGQEVQAGTVAARMTGTSLEIMTLEPTLISAELVAIDGRKSTILTSEHGRAGVNRFDLSSHLDRLPQGAYFLRILVGSELLTVNLIR